MKQLGRMAVAAIVATAVLSCGGGDSSVAPPTLTTLIVSFPAGTVAVGQSAGAVAVGLDQFGASIATGTVSWSTGSTTVATVDARGLITGVAPGQTQVIASVGGKQAQAAVAVIPVPVAAVRVAPSTATMIVGTSQQLTATVLDANNNILSDRAVTWETFEPTKVTVSSTGFVTAVAEGSATITATTAGISGGSQITVIPPCTSARALQLAVSEIHPMSAAEKTALCLGGGASSSEYVLIPFNSLTTAALRISVTITATNTAAIQPGSLASLQAARSRSIAGFAQESPAKSFEWAFRERERRDLAPAFASHPRASRTGLRNIIVPSYITGVPATPLVGTVVPINTNISGNTCTSAKRLHGAVVVAVLPHTIVLSDTLSPAGGYTGEEMTAFGQSFDTIGYALDTTNFGASTDIDGNERVVILFTPGVNVVPAPPGARVGGLFTARDLFPVSTCPGSNEGEMFYMPVPDPDKTINGNYAIKSDIARPVLSTLVHEFQHLINDGRRIYVNNASSAEEVWLNEGLSHIAEELLYYRISGNLPRSNVDQSVVQSSQAQTDALNTYERNNLLRLGIYLGLPESNSPFSQVDGLEMRGAIWQLLRYSADRKGGLEQNTWTALVNTRLVGQINFNAVFGDIITMTRDWSVAQFVDDAGFLVSPENTNPSWNYRSVIPLVNGGTFPLLTHPLLSAPLDITLSGGGAAYIRFGVAANAPAAILANSSGQPVPSVLDFILMRTK
jgi:hypothetical protein